MYAQKLVTPKESRVPCPAPWVKPQRISKIPRFSAAEIIGDLFPIMQSGLNEYKITKRKCLHAVYKTAKPRPPLQEFNTSSEHYNMKAAEKATEAEETCRKKQTATCVECPQLNTWEKGCLSVCHHEYISSTVRYPLILSSSQWGHNTTFPRT